MDSCHASAQLNRDFQLLSIESITHRHTDAGALTLRYLAGAGSKLARCCCNAFVTSADNSFVSPKSID